MAFASCAWGSCYPVAEIDWIHGSAVRTGPGSNLWLRYCSKDSHCDVYHTGNGAGAAEAVTAGPQCFGLLHCDHPFPWLPGGFVPSLPLFLSCGKGLILCPVVSHRVRGKWFVKTFSCYHSVFQRVTPLFCVKESRSFFGVD